VKFSQSSPNKHCHNLQLRLEFLPSTECSMYFGIVGKCAIFWSVFHMLSNFSLRMPVYESPNAVTLFSILCHLSPSCMFQWSGAAGEPARLYSPSMSCFSVGPTKRSTRDTSPVIFLAIPMTLIFMSSDLANIYSTNHPQTLHNLMAPSKMDTL